MRKFKDLSKEEQRTVLDELMAEDAEDLMKRGDYYESLSSGDKKLVDSIISPGSLCGCYACVQSLLKNIQTFNLPVREGMIGRAMQKAEARLFP